jgi:hypothetical protein
MKLIGSDGFLELERSLVGGPDSPPDPDILLNVTVQVGGYSAADQSWVTGDAWDGFLTDLKKLDEQRQGLAIVEGASPDDLRLEFYSTDSAGHMAVKGHLGWCKPDGHVLGMKFAFSFEPDLLPNLVQAICAL